MASSMQQINALPSHESSTTLHTQLLLTPAGGAGPRCIHGCDVCGSPGSRAQGEAQSSSHLYTCTLAQPVSSSGQAQGLLFRGCTGSSPGCALHNSAVRGYRRAQLAPHQGQPMFLPAPAAQVPASRAGADGEWQQPLPKHSHRPAVQLMLYHIPIAHTIRITFKRPHS